MLRTGGDILDQVLVRANVTTTATGLYTDAILKDWGNDAHRWAAAQRKWPFTEGRVSTTFASEETTYPEGWKSDSIRLLTIGGKAYQKLDFTSYQTFKEDRPDADDRVYSDFGGILYVNANGTSGTMIAYGQYTPAELDLSDLTSASALTVFSDKDEEGNEAIVEEILKYAYIREKKPDEAQLHHQRAVDIVEGIWKRYSDEQFGYHSSGEGMWKRIDVLQGASQEENLKRDQWY